MIIKDYPNSQGEIGIHPLCSDAKTRQTQVDQTVHDPVRVVGADPVSEQAYTILCPCDAGVGKGDFRVGLDIPKVREGHTAIGGDCGCEW